MINRNPAAERKLPAVHPLHLSTTIFTAVAVILLTACGPDNPEPPSSPTTGITNTTPVVVLPTSTSTWTIIPPAVQTAQAVAWTETSLSLTSTAVENDLHVQETATAHAINYRATEITTYKVISYDKLFYETHEYTGTRVKIAIDIYRIISDKELLGNFATTSIPLYVKMRDPFTDLRRGDRITVYGYVAGSIRSTSIAGLNTPMPLINLAFYKK